MRLPLIMIVSLGLCGGVGAWFLGGDDSPSMGTRHASPATEAASEVVTPEATVLAQPVPVAHRVADETKAADDQAEPTTAASTEAAAPQRQYGPWTLQEDGTLITQRWVEIEHGDGTREAKLVTMRATPRRMAEPPRRAADRLAEMIERSRNGVPQTPR